MWQKSGSDSGTRSWSQAGVYIESLNATNYLGYEDWRLPTRNELQSLLDYDGSYMPATEFPGASSDKYWSSTTQSGTTSNAWYADFEYGAVDTNLKTISTYYVRAVRSGSCWAECLSDQHCDDGVACNGEETCKNVTCVPGTPTCEEIEYCDESTDTCVECLTDDHCDDGEFCNGTETCTDGLCLDATPPCEGDTPICDEEGERCVECIE
jgi:hypothetical protein